MVKLCLFALVALTFVYLADSKIYTQDENGDPEPIRLARWLWRQKRAIPRGTCGLTAVKQRKLYDENGVRIVGGVEARPKSFPWIVSLQYGRSHYCGGSLIQSGKADESDIIMTAGHCVKDRPSGLNVVAGAHDISKSEASQQRIVGYQSIALHPEFASGTLLNDIALVKLSKPIKFNDNVQPVCLPEPGEILKSNTVVSVAGWGVLQEDSRSASDVLMQVSFPVVDSNNCASSYRSSGVFVNPDTMMCAGITGKDSCQGDSGGPLTMSGKDGNVQHGIVSFGIGCAREKPGVYTRVSMYTDWINTQIRVFNSV